MGRHTGKNETKVMKRMKEISAKIQKMKISEDSNTDLKESRESLRIAMETQETAHAAVEQAAEAAQEAHDLMLQWNKEVDTQREKAESAHRPSARVEVQDLMGKLMSGETLSTEELMQLQRYD
jgi:uncharacterized coiled-coil DUF342 family protein